MKLSRRDLFRGALASAAVVAFAPVKKIIAFIAPSVPAPRVGFLSLMWHGVPIYSDPSVPSGQMYYMNRRYVTDPGTWLKIADGLESSRPSALAPMFDAAKGA